MLIVVVDENLACQSPGDIDFNAASLAGHPAFKATSTATNEQSCLFVREGLPFHFIFVVTSSMASASPTMEIDVAAAPGEKSSFLRSIALGERSP